MYSAFGKYPGDWLAIPKAIKYWMGQHSIARIPGPWYYYFPQLLFYDTAIVFAAIFAFSRRQWRSDPFLRVLRAAFLPIVAYLLLRWNVPGVRAARDRLGRGHPRRHADPDAARPARRGRAAS